MVTFAQKMKRTMRKEKGDNNEREFVSRMSKVTRN